MNNKKQTVLLIQAFLMCASIAHAPLNARAETAIEASEKVESTDAEVTDTKRSQEVEHTTDNTQSTETSDSSLIEQKEGSSSESIQQPEEQGRPEISKEEIEGIKKKTLSLLTATDFALETIAVYVKSDDISVEENNKETVIKNIQELRKCIDLFKKDLMMYATIESIDYTVSFIMLMQHHIKEEIKSGLKNFSLIDISPLQKRSPSQTDSETLKEKISLLHDELAHIKNDAEKAGIHWYNKIYRTIDAYTIEPILKHEIHKKTGWTAVVSSALVYFWYRLSEDTYGCQDLEHAKAHPEEAPVGLRTNYYNPDTQMPLPGGDINRQPLPTIADDGYINYLYGTANGYMRAKLGVPKIDDKFRDHYIRNNQPFYFGLKSGKLAKFDEFLTLFNTGTIAIGSYLYWPLLQTFYSSSIQPLLNKIEYHIFNTHCWLKGGIYYKNNKNKLINPFSMTPRYRFKDIIGNTEIKILGNEFVEFVKDPEKYQNQNLGPPKGILIHGPPGTGKSHFVEALCGEIQDGLKSQGKNEKDFRFIVIKARDIQMHGLETILYYIKSWAPCIVFLDEIDLLSLQRDRNPERLSEFLSGVSGFLESSDPKKQVIFIGATNKIENVDGAVLRSGRLTKKIYLDYPTYESRKAFLVRTLSDRINPDLFDLEKIARQTDGCTIEDLRLIVNTALFKTRIECQPLTQKDLENALNSEVRKIVIHQEASLSNDELRVLAAHMAGHALAYLTLPTNKLLSAVTIKPVVEKVHEKLVWQVAFDSKKESEPGQVYGKVFTYTPQDSLGLANSKTIINECKINLAGRIAEKLLLGSASCANPRTCSGYCKLNAFNFAKQILLDGMPEDNLSKQMKEQLAEKATNMIAELEKEVEEMLVQQKPLLMFIADILEQRKTISYEEIMKTLQDTFEQVAKENPELLEEIEKEMKEKEATAA